MEYRNKISKVLIRCGFVFLLAFALSANALAAGVQALFNLDVRSEAPFPTNWFSVPDASNNTNIRVNLPYPDCTVFVSDCEDIDVINTLDGFNLQPRLSIPFDGPIDVNTVTSETVFLISLGSTLDRGGDPPGTVVGINQVVWDPETNTLHVESDELVDQHTRYALIVTRGVRAESGASVEATETFRRFRHVVRGEYKQALLDAIHAARRIDVREDDIAVASVFTTQSATAIMERIRDQIKATTAAPADFVLGSNGERTVFAFNSVTGITWNQQTRVQGPLTPVKLDLSLLNFFPGSVGQLAFGKFLSQNYLVHPGEFIPDVGTRTGIPAVQGINEVYFDLVLPSGPMPEGGWPVAILGHGFTASGHGPALVSIASEMAHRGIATIIFNAVGHGFGALGTLTVRQGTSVPVTLPAGGRGIDQNGDGIIGNREGLSAAQPWAVIDSRDGTRQTVIDLLQLVRVIEVGMDADGDGIRDLDPSRMYYFGRSFGAIYGTIFVAVEPQVPVGAFAVPGGAYVDWTRLGPAFRPNVVGSTLALRTPSLINPPGLTTIGGVAVGPPHFNENMPLRNEPPRIDNVPGARAIQEYIENTEWVSQAGNPVVYARHLRKAPLQGMQAKSVLFLFAKGDQSVPNPTNTAIMRSGDLADRATFFRHDLAFAEFPTLPKNPHGFHNLAMSQFLLTAVGSQAQIGTFLSSQGQEIIHPEPARFFEVPIMPPLPEELNYIP